MPILPSRAKAARSLGHLHQGVHSFVLALAPPVAETQTNGRRRLTARSMARAIFSPTATPMLPPWKAKLFAATTKEQFSIAPRPQTTASADTGRTLVLGNLVGVGLALAAEGKRVGTPEIAVQLLKGSRIQQQVQPLLR